MAKAEKPKDMDGYISKFPADVQVSLGKVRVTIRHAAPEATETVSYRMPPSVSAASWSISCSAKHIGMYPPISGNKTLEKAIARYTGPKGNLQFPLDEPMPFDLIERIVKLRVKQDSEKAAAKRKKKSQTSRKPKPRIGSAGNGSS